MLMEFGKVSVPSIGTFTLQYTEAAFKNNKSVLSPPSTTLLFSKEEDHQNDFATLLGESGMGQSDAMMLQDLVVKDYNDAVASQLPFEFDRLGTLVDKVFLTKDDSFFNRYHGLGDIDVHPVPLRFEKINHDEDFLYRLNAPVKPQAANNFREYFWPVLAGLFVLAFILMWLFTNKSEQTMLPTEIAPVTEPLVQEIIADTATTVTMDTVLTEKEIVDNIGGDTTQNNKIPVGKSNTGIQNNKPIQAFAGSTCVVIVGAFKNPANARKLQKKIEKSGYETYTAEHNGFKRVGIAYKCSNNDPDVFKNKVKKLYNKNAWYLHDTI